MTYIHISNSSLPTILVDILNWKTMARTFNFWGKMSCSIYQPSPDSHIIRHHDVTLGFMSTVTIFSKSFTYMFLWHINYQKLIRQNHSPSYDSTIWFSEVLLTYQKLQLTTIEPLSTSKCFSWKFLLIVQNLRVGWGQLRKQFKNYGWHMGMPNIHVEAAHSYLDGCCFSQFSIIIM